jgi:hypothetical protein
MTRDEYLVALEKELQDPLNVLSYEDEFPAEHKFPFTVQLSSNAGAMSQRELFVYKVVLWRWRGELEDMAPTDSDAVCWSQCFRQVSRRALQPQRR